MTNGSDDDALVSVDNLIGKLPDHLLIEIFVRVPVTEWAQISCVRKHWANLFRGECLWQAALAKSYPSASQAKRWPGPIPRGLSRRRFAALYISKLTFSLDGDMDEIVGHAYLFLKDQLELSTMPPPSGVLHGTMIDQFIACGKSRDVANELASQIWIAVLDNLEENEHTFLLLKRLAQEADGTLVAFEEAIQRSCEASSNCRQHVFLPYPYSRSIKVQWRVFEKLFTDFRDCFNHVDYYDVLSCAKNRFQAIPSAWLGGGQDDDDLHGMDGHRECANAMSRIHSVKRFLLLSNVALTSPGTNLTRTKSSIDSSTMLLREALLVQDGRRHVGLLLQSRPLIFEEVGPMGHES